MTMRNGTALDIDDVVWEAELLSNGKRHGGECLIDLKALDIAEPPVGARERLLHSRHRTEAEHARLDGGDAIADEPRHGFNRLGVGEGTVGDDHGGRAAIEAWRIAGRDCATFTEGWAQLGEPFERRV